MPITAPSQGRKKIRNNINNNVNDYVALFKRVRHAVVMQKFKV